MVAAALAFALLGAPARAAEVKLSGLVYAQYAQTVSRKTEAGLDARGRGEFAVPRLYVTAEAKLSPKASGKITLEGNTNSNKAADATTGHGNNPVFVKFAYLDYAPHELVHAQLGMVANPWVGFEDNLWGRRYVQKVLADHTGKVNAADKGAGLLVKLPRGYGDLHATYVNGEGVTANEVQPAAANNDDGRYKDALLRLSVAPLPGLEVLKGLKLHGFIQQGRVGFGQAMRRDRYIAGGSFEHERFHVMATYLVGNDGDGVLNRAFQGSSLHGSVKLPWDTAVFLKLDRYSKEATAATITDAYRRGVVGVEVKLAEGARVALSDAWFHPARPILVTRNNENQLMVSTEFKF